MLGLIYLFGQIIGSILAGFLGIFLLEPHNKNENYKCSIEPMEENKESIALMSEMFGTAIFVSHFLIHTDKSTRFSDDKSINSMIIASSYVASRLMCGGNFITGIPQYGLHSHIDENGTLTNSIEKDYF
jgi:glycerol uptake facilitator-like aquaporin